MIQNYAWLHAAWLVPGLALLYYYGQHRRRQALRRFVDAKLLPSIEVSASRVRQEFKADLFCLKRRQITQWLTQSGFEQ